MGWFQKKPAANNVDASLCNPIIVNQTNHSVVLFLDRGVLYNKQVLAPGEAVGMTRQETAGTILPYKIHAVVGDAKSLPTRTQSMKNLISTAVIPTAFIVGTLAAASSAGTLTGPSAALGRVAGGIVVRGMVIDSAALAAGSLTASRAAYVADQLMEKHPENFSAKSSLCLPGYRHVVVRGGIDHPLTVTTIAEKEFRQIPIVGEVKVPMDTLQDKVEYYTSSLFLRSSTKSGESVQATEAEAGSSDSAAAAAQIEGQHPLPTAPTEAEQEEQIRLAIAESLSLEEERKQQEEQQKKRASEKPRRSVVLF